jgi:hypothetical protein
VSTLHVTNGDCAADTLRTIADEPVTTTCDVLHEGPCPPVDGDPWYDVRARFLSDSYGARFEETKRGLRETDDTIAAAGEVVLWFEHDLFDQLLLIRLLDLLGRGRPAPARRASMICIGAFPGIDRFVGLGQLTGAQLATLIGTEVAVSADQFAVAAEAWRAFRSPDPAAILRTARQPRTSVLPFLGDALLRLLAEFPSAANGLSRTEQLALEALLAGPHAAAALFAAAQAPEPRPFMGDRTFFDMLGRMGSARVPLVTVEGRDADADPRQRRIAITDAGRAVLAGRADHVRLNGVDVWRGGIHLTGSDRSPWRWDTGAETLVS